VVKAAFGRAELLFAGGAFGGLLSRIRIEFGLVRPLTPRRAGPARMGLTPSPDLCYVDGRLKETARVWASSDLLGVVIGEFIVTDACLVLAVAVRNSSYATMTVISPAPLTAASGRCQC